MAQSPFIKADRNASDYLFAVDPSGQFIWGYSWDHCGKRPDDIYNVHGSGQCLNNGVPSGEFKLFAKEFVETARMPAYRNPLYLAGPGYDIYGASFGLVPSSGHTVFKDNIPVIDFVNGDMSNYRSGPIDLRFDEFRQTWTTPYTSFLAIITSIAENGHAFKLDGSYVSTLPVRHYYSIASGLFRYRAQPFALPGSPISQSWPYQPDPNYPTFSLLNIAELNNDLPYMLTGDTVMVMRNPTLIASGSYLCNERPVAFAAFI
jgi:hypothetical protein